MTREKTSPEASARPRRVSVTERNRLKVQNQDPNYVYRIVNDEDDRVARLQEMGYELCDKEHVGAQVGNRRVDNTSSLGSTANFSVGQGVKAVIMRQKREWYEEDQRLKQKEIDEVEAAMKKAGKNGADYGKVSVD